MEDTAEDENSLLIINKFTLQYDDKQYDDKMKQYQAMKEQDSTPPPTLGTKIIQHTLDLYPFSDFTNNDQGYILNMHIIDSSHQFGLLLAILK